MNNEPIEPTHPSGPEITQNITEYIYKGASRPYLYPVNAVDGTSLVRDFPMKDTPGEDHDHKHHRALMFAHSDVNKVDFWNEGTSGTRFPKGDTVHDGFAEVKDGGVGVIRTKNRWVAPDGKLIATGSPRKRFDRAKKLASPAIITFDVRDGMNTHNFRSFAEGAEEAGVIFEAFMVEQN